MRSVTIALLFVGCVLATEDRASGQTPVTLTASSSKVVGTASLTASGSTQCDSKGDLFFYTGVAPHDSVILKLLADGSHEVYGLVGEDAKSHYYVSFRADSDGRLWLLAGNDHDKPVVFRFMDDPTSPARTELETPPGMDAPTVRNFIELRSGHFFLQGFWGESGTKKNQGRGYLAEFDSSGRLLRISIEKDRPGFDLSDWPGDAVTMEGEDGSIYILEPARIVVLSQALKVVRKITLQPPEAGYRPYQAYLSGRRLEVSYYKASKQPAPLDALYVLIDASSGKRLRVYRAAPELGNSLLCFSDEAFTFYRTEGGRIKLVTARAE